MTHYKVVPAPITGKKSKDAKTAEDRFALAMSDTLNEMAAAGWQYVRAETLPCEERKGLTGKTTVFQNMLIFSRPGDMPQTDVIAASEPLHVEPHAEVETEEDRTAPVLLTDRAEEHDSPPPLGGARRDD